MSYNPLDLLIGALAVWRLSAMIAYERGPFKMFEWMRAKAGIFHFDDGSPDHDLAKKEIQKLMLCVWCSGFWVALIWFVGYSLNRDAVLIISLPFAMNALAIGMETVFHK